MSQNQKIPSQLILMNNMYILIKKVTSSWDGHNEILCEDGEFYRAKAFMNGLYRPILFSSRKEAAAARRVFGHWPTYKIVKVTDPSWLCE